MKNKRYDWVDVLKFLGIFYIFVGHFGWNSGKFYYFVFQFHVPLFFFASGFFFKQEKKFKKFAWEKFISIMIPYFVFSFIHLFLIAINNSYSMGTCLDWSISIVKGIRNTLPAGGIWFLPCLYLTQLFYFILIKLFKKKKFVFVVSLILYYFALYGLKNNPLVLPSMFWNFDTALLYLVYFTIGNITFVWLKKLDYQKLKINQKIIFLSFCIFFFSFSILFFFKGRLYFGGFLLYPLRYTFDLFATLILIFSNCLLAYFLKNVENFKKIGQNTLLLCCNEATIRLLFTNFFLFLNIEIQLSTPLITLLYAYLMLAFGEKYIVSIGTKIVEKVQKYFKKNSPLFQKKNILKQERL